MSLLVALSAIGLPIAMIAGAIAAWRLLKQEEERDKQPGWKDTSLDDWRRERDAEVEVERAGRVSEAQELQDNAIAESKEAHRQQRIGG